MQQLQVHDCEAPKDGVDRLRHPCCKPQAGRLLLQAIPVAYSHACNRASSTDSRLLTFNTICWKSFPYSVRERRIAKSREGGAGKRVHAAIAVSNTQFDAMQITMPVNALRDAMTSCRRQSQ